MKLFAFTLDLEPDYAGNATRYEILKNDVLIKEILPVISSTGVKMTAFTVGEMFELYPNVIKEFEKYDCEFEAHSYSHDINKPDTEEEIMKCKQTYYKYFGKYPKGYRAPQGRISYAGIKMLEKHGFLYDSSLCPSYYPNPFLYLFRNRKIHYYNNSRIMEIPSTSITPFRITLSLSYIKLFGIDFFLKLCRFFELPDIICFNSHLHDFIFNETSYNGLSPFWKFIFGRNKFSGLEYCVTFVEHIKKMGYRFCYMSELYELNKK